MALLVAQPGGASPAGEPGIPITEYFTHKLAMADSVMVPSSYEFSGKKERLLGEQAEKEVVRGWENCVKGIPGLKVITFHSHRITAQNPAILREVDTISFAMFDKKVLHFCHGSEVQLSSKEEQQHQEESYHPATLCGRNATN